MSDDFVYSTLTQCGYQKQKQEKFGMTECDGAQTLVDPLAKLSFDDCPAEGNAYFQKEHRAKVGSLQYLSIWTRPILSYSVMIHSSYFHRPGPKHFLADD